jgi:hypothetical protein
VHASWCISSGPQHKRICRWGQKYCIQCLRCCENCTTQNHFQVLLVWLVFYFLAAEAPFRRWTKHNPTMFDFYPSNLRSVFDQVLY